MEHDWSYVKKVTLWNYEEVLEKLHAVLVYPLICQAYNHSMPEAMDFARCLFPANDIDAGEFPAAIVTSMGRLQTAGIRDWADLLEKVGTREACSLFLAQHHIGFEEMIDVLKYLLRWAFPFHTAAREVLDHDDLQEMQYYPVLKAHHQMSSFDLLEHGNTKAKRVALAKQTGLPLDFINQIVHRADIARLPYVRRKTILPVCGAGYDTLARIAAAKLPKMESDMESYFQSQGRSWDDFKSVIVLRGLIAGAQALPKIMLS